MLRPASLLGLFGVFIILPTTVFGYTITLLDNFEDDVVIFDASIGKSRCEYSLRDMSCSNLPFLFSINNHGGISALRGYYYKTEIEKYGVNSCTFVVDVNKCKNFYKTVFKIPMNVQILPSYDLASTPIHMLSLNISITSNDPKSNLPLVDKIDDIIEALSLTHCDIRTEIIDEKVYSDSKFEPRKLSTCEKRIQNVTLIQSLRHCKSRHSFAIPNQDVVIKVKSVVKDCAEIPDIHEISPRRILKRRKRSYGNRLSFIQNPRKVDIEENRKTGTEVVALELNNPSNMPVTYTWIPMNNKQSSDLFNLDSNTGVVTTTQSLNREDMSSHTFRVTARSKSGPNQSASCSLIISVVDVNDNQPVFDQSLYQFHFREDELAKFYVGKVTASDKDTGLNKRIQYKINGLQPPDVFKISNDGEITLGRAVDREKTAQYNFTVSAIDGGTPAKSSIAKVSVTIDDVNDIRPRFTESQYKVKINEDTKRNVNIKKVTAVDSDAGANGRITYSLMMSSDRNFFRINPRTGDISVIANIDSKNHPNGFRLRVRAQDGGRPPKYASCIVVVDIVDVNDNAPKFLRYSSYNKEVRENEKIGFEVAQIKAVDSDSGENARISYSFVESIPDLPFRINNTSGRVTISRNLDYEKAKAYHLTVRAMDHGSPRKSSTIGLDITIQNVNDNKPKFTLPVYRVRVNEDRDLGSEVIKVTAKDADEDAYLHYQIITGNLYNKFDIIDADNVGVISLAQPLDFNQRKSYVLTVLCSDGALSSTAQVRINVTDANTHIPEFDQSSYENTVLENVRVGHVVETVHATDGDVGENAKITYELQSPSSLFALDSKTGKIKTTGKLDYDTMSQHYLTVVAKDNGVPQHQTETLVTIYLEDVNDNSPVFSQPQYSASVSEDVVVDTSVTRIEAEDKDSGKNGQVVYTFDGGDNGGGAFKIDQSSGVIRAAESLDREHIAEYRLIAFASDRGSPPKKTQVTILVSLIDVDDNPPQFASDELHFDVKEDSPVGSIVAKLKAVDPDEGLDMKIIYEIAMEAGDDDFSQWDLNYRSGELSPRNKLDYETKSKYTLTVSAYSGPLVSQVKVIINLIDVNDNPPVLNDFQIIFNNYRTQKPYTFPFGPIGKIPAYDPDATSVLRYRFTSGNNTLLILNETTGELRLSSKLDNDREFTAPFKVEVSDGKFSVTGDCILKVVPITDEMLTNSVTVRVEEMSQENFLSNAMKQFIHGLGQILDVSTQDVYIFNVQNDTDVTPHAVVNVSFSAKHPAGNYFTTQHLQEQVYLNRSLLTNYSMQNVMPFDDNICLREPCENYMRCVSALYFNSSAPFVSTQTVLFRPIHPVSGLRCKCPAGFAGEGCENEVNLCHGNRCKNNGQCISVEGGYVCACNGTFTGQHCEVNLVGSQCEDAKGICKNGAKCHPYPVGGFRCDCTQGGLIAEELTPFCELRGRSFRKGDFAMFSGITRQWRFTLSLSFATREKSGLLLYNGRFNHEHDYLALEIVDGQVQLNFSTGQNYTVVSPYLKGGVNDGSWHTILIEYHNKPNFVALGRGHTGPSNVKVVTLTIDPDTCDPAISTKWSSCSRTVEQGGTKSSLDLTTPLLIGGVPNLPEAYQVRSRNYIGCIRDLEIDHSRVDMSHLVTNHGSQPGCRALRNHCSKNPCSSGTCSNTYGTYKCKCDGDHGGKRCERIQPVFRLQGVGCLKHRQVSLLPKPMSMPWTHAFAIRTTKMTGTLLHMMVYGGLKVEMSLNDGKISYSVEISRRNYKNQMDTAVNDGEWHDIVVEWRMVNSNIQIDIKIDSDTEKDLLLLKSVPASLNPTTGRITDLYIGGRWMGSRVANAFTGCVRGLEFTSRGLVHTVPGDSLQKTRNALVSKGCAVQNPCRSARCPSNSDCVTNFDTYECKCHKGYVGDQCNSACVLNPCREGSKCTLKSSKPYGYECQCSKPIYYGRTCQSEHIQPCPSGWHGYPICTPCNCPVERNFDPNCNNDKGICKCKEYHFFNTVENMCLPCNCYHVGSIGLNCSNEIGQCRCKPGVTGKQCNMCSSKFAEVTDNGCRVLYNECPHAMEDGIKWHRAEFGDTKPARCPTDATGIAFRTCTKEDGWLEAKLGNCTSIPYHDLKKDLQNLLDNPDYLTEHSVRAALDAAHRLFEASNGTGKLYQGDILMSYRMLTNILEMQNSLSEFDLAASRGAAFNDYLINSASHALASENLQHWSALQSDPRYKSSKKNLVSSAKLLQDFEDYAATLTSNMDSIYYHSISSNAGNVKLKIQTASNLEEERIAINSSSPEEQDLVSIVLPPQKNTDVPDDGTVGVIEFSTLGSILPMEFHDSRLDMRIPQKPFINSAVVTVVTHHRVNYTTRSNQELIVLTFSLLRDDGSDPQCVFWNFTARNGEGLGGWSQKGCSTKKSNKTHVTCSCSHLTSFAIVSDEEVVSVLEELPVKIMLYTSVVIILVCVIICFGFTCFLEDVKSNHAKIHSNFAISIFFSELCFAVGIMQTSNTFVCMAVAIFIHFFFMSTFAWVVVEGLHLYRMLKEKKDINRGNMRVYYLFGWGIPAIISALSVGLDAKGFGNANFCWITLDHLLVWSFIGPLLFCTIVYLLLFFLTLYEYLTSKLPDTKRFDTKSNIKSSFVLLPFVSALWVFALFAVNENKAIYYFLFSLINVCLGVLLILLHCVFNKEVRDALRNVKERRWQRRELNTTKQHLLTNSVHTPNTSNGHRRVNMFTSASSTSTTNTANRRNNHQDSSMFHDMGDVPTDSDSDISDSSISLASTHSSDEEIPEERPTYLNMNNSSNWPHKNGHLPNRKQRENRLVVHSTPKENKDHDNNYQPSPRNGSASSKNDGGSYKSSLPTVSEANIEHEQPEEPHYLAINSLQKNNGKIKSDDEHEMIPMQDMDSLPKKGILKNGKRSKPPTPVRVDSLRTNSPIHQFDTDETSLLKQKQNTLEKVKVMRNSPCPSQEEQML